MSKFDIFNPIAISAGAGSGKTYTLSRRYINILVGFNLFFEDLQTEADPDKLQAASPAEIVTITYTEAGALEMKSRIFGLIQKVLAFSYGRLDGEDGDYWSIEAAFGPIKDSPQIIKHIQISLEQALTQLPAAIISTIHAYCLDLIDQFGDYLKLDAKPSIIPDDEKIVLFSEVYRDTLNCQEVLVEEIDQTISLYRLSKIAQKYSFNAQFREAFDNYASSLKHDGKELQHDWMAQKILPEREAIIEGLKAAEEMAVADPRKKQYRDALYSNLEAALTGEGEWTGYEGQLRKNKALTDEILAPVRKLKDVVGSLWATVVDSERESHYTATLLKIQSLFSAMHDAFNARLHKEGYTDFETILQYANRLLEHDISLPTRYFMVDEFQDTNAYQWGIVTKAAAKKSANIFIVGDEKQSIFSFQGADVSVFAKASSEIDAKKLSMGINRRSDKAIIALVNRVFGNAMALKEISSSEPMAKTAEPAIDGIIDTLNAYMKVPPIINDFEATYEPLSTPELRPEGSVTLLVTPVEQSDKCEDECSESEQEMRHIASFIKEAVVGESYPKVKVAYDEGKKAIAVLFDTRKQMLLLKEKLLQLGLKAKVSDSGNFYATKEVNDIFIVLKLLTRIPNLDFSDLSRREKYVIIGALRSNILRCDGDAIEAVLQSGELPSICREWLRQSDYLTPSQLIEKIVNDSQLLHLYRHLEGFEQRAANIEKLIGMAYDFEIQKGADFKAYVRELESFIHNEDVTEEEAFVIEEGVGSIEIRTMHSSKGLEWPMVILGSTNRSFMGMQPSEDLVYDAFNGQEMVGFGIGNYKPLAYRFIKERTNAKHIAERKRLLYVGMTRPEHHLVISTAVNDYGTGPRLCYNCGIKNYFSLINDELGLDLAALYAGSIESVGNIDIRYPGEWLGKESGIQHIDVVLPQPLKPLSFNESKLLRPSGVIDPLGFLEDRIFDAGSAGTVVHKIIEECWQVLENDESCFTQWLDAFSVPDEWREYIIAMAKAFTDSAHYEKVKAGAEAYFEHDYSIVDNEGNCINGSIDLFYYDESKEGWVIVDFKTTALRGMSEEEVMVHHGYDKQLEFYASYVESVMGQGRVVGKEICWLNK